MKSLNHIYRTIWSEALGAWIAVSEITRSKGKRAASSLLRAVQTEAGSSAIERDEFRVRLKPVLFALACCFAMNAQANPVGGAVVNGQASFNTSGNTLTVTNTPGTIINWQGFSINANEVTHFAQQSAASTVLNHVVTNNPSVILGTLSSNGQVYLVNANGITFGAGATVDVAGLVATSLNLSDADFLAGRHNFTAVPGAQNISNSGNITSQPGGKVYLIAPNVENNGIITAPNGEILLAAGNSVELVNSNDPNLRVKITAPAGDATNIGQLVAGSGNLGLFGTVVRNSGSVSADSAVMQGGKIVFRASQNTEVSGAVSATGTTGGSIAILGNQVAVLGNVDASGTDGGGTVLIGGDAHGANTSVQNAQVSYVDAAATIKADAWQSGNGGKVVVWADKATQFGGSISARGGATSGNGGWVETSGKQWLGFAGLVDTSAPNGLMGSLLLDPTDITISTAAQTASMTWTLGTLSYTDTSLTPSNLNVTTLQTQLASTNVTVDTTSGLAGTGNITVQNAVTWASANTLTLNATGTGSINTSAGANITNTGSGGVTMQTAGGAISITSSNITLAGGTFTANAGAGTIALGGTTVVSTGAGAVNLTGGWIREAGGRIITSGTLTTNSTSASGTSLNNGGLNQIGNLVATASGGGNLIVQNGSAINLVNVNASGGAIINTNVGGMTISGPVNGGTSSVSLQAYGITNNSTISGNAGVSLVAGYSGFAPVGTLTNNGVITNGGGTNTGAIIMSGDIMVLGGGTVTAGAGAVNLVNVTLANAINVGSAVDTTPTTLELSNAELATISTTGRVSIGGTGNSGAMTVSAPLTLSNHTTLANGTAGIAINGAINTGTRNLTINTTGTATQTAAITAAGLELLGTGTHTLTNTGNSIGTVAGSAGSINLVDSTALSVGSVNTAGLTATGAISLTSGGAITQTAAISTPGQLTTSSAAGTTLNAANTVGSLSAANSTSGNISFTNNAALNIAFGGVINSVAGGSVSLTDTAVNTALSIGIATIGTNNGAITLTADKMNLWVGTGANTSAGSGNVTLQNFTATNAINVGSTVDTTAGTLEISQTELNFINTTGLLTIGNTANSGAITVSAATTLAHNTALVNGSGGVAINGAITASVNNLTLNTAGSATQTAAISATGLELLTGNYSLTNTGNAVGTVAGNATSVSLTNNSNLSVGTVNTVGLTATGAINLSAFGGALTQTAGITTPGLLTTSSYSGTTLGGSNNVGSLSGSIGMVGGFTFNNTGPGTLTVNGITNSGGSGISVTNAGTITIMGAINGGTGAVNLTTTGASGWIREVGPSGLITAGTLTTSNSSSAGTSLNGGTNMIGALNATDVGLVHLINGTALNVTGISASDVLLSNTGSITIGGAIATSGSVDMTGVGITNNSTISGTTAGVVLNAGTGTLTNAGTISSGSTGNIVLTADKMVLAAGTVNAGAAAVNLSNSTLTNAVNLGSTVDTTNGTLELSNAELATIHTTGLLTVGNASSSGAVTVSSALTLNQDTNINSGSAALTINGAITATGKTLSLSSTNIPSGVTQGAGGAITAATLRLLGGSSGYFNLNNASNSFATVAGDVGTLVLVDNAPLVVGSSGGLTGLNGTYGVQLTSNTGSITQTAAVTTTGLLWTTAATGVNLVNTSNSIGTFRATSTSGDISLVNSGLVGMGLDSLVASNGNISITSDSLGMANTFATFTSSGLFKTSTKNGANLSNLYMGIHNSVGSFSATNTTSGGISFDNAGPLTIAGISQSGGGGVTITSTGDITVSGAITTSGVTAASLASSAGNIILNNSITGSGGALNLALSHGSVGSATLASSLALQGGSLDVQSLGSTGTGTLNVSAGAISDSGALKAATLVNNGSVSLSGSSAVTGALTQNGLLDIAAGGTLTTPGFTNTGTLSGGGTLNLGTGTLTNNGIITPGGAGTVGTFSITGNLVMGTTGAVNMNVVTPAPGNFDVLSVTGTATLTSGTMNISGTGAGTYDLLTAGGGFGSTKFASINSSFPALTATYAANTLSVDLQYLITDNQLSELVKDTLIEPREAGGRKPGLRIALKDAGRGGARGASPATVCR